jgi:hypothetical protein
LNGKLGIPQPVKGNLEQPAQLIVFRRAHQPAAQRIRNGFESPNTLARFPSGPPPSLKLPVLVLPLLRQQCPLLACKRLASE